MGQEEKKRKTFSHRKGCCSPPRRTAVVLRGKLLEALHTDIRAGLELPEDAPGQQVLLVCRHFGRGGGREKMRLESGEEVTRAR